MNKKDLRIVYMGTPDFAVPTLERLIAEGYNVVGVITMPDKPVGRHQNQLQASPVKQCALKHNIPVLQPEKLKNEEFLAELRALKADLQIVVAFRMLPEVVWAMPRLGTFNLHAALLPQYRGAAPINWAIINGDTETGITTFFLDKDIDTGQIIQQQRIPIGSDDNVEDIHYRLMMLGAELVCETVQNIIDGKVKPIPQDQLAQAEELRPAPKIFRETCQIQWEYMDIRTLHNFVRGLSPYPGAWTTIISPDGNETTMKILKTEIVEENECNVGDIWEIHKVEGRISIKKVKDAVGYQLDTSTPGELRIKLENGVLRILELQLAGKKRMLTADLLRGTSLEGYTLSAK